jgi:hypothetical protein
MSAYILSDLHFSVIAYYVEGLNPNIKAQELADKLKSINIDSVNYRYNEKTRKTKCKLTRDNVNYTNPDIIRLIQCWDYQSCEKGDNLDYLIMSAFLYSSFCMIEIDNARYNSDKWSI